MVWTVISADRQAGLIRRMALSVASAFHTDAEGLSNSPTLGGLAEKRPLSNVGRGWDQHNMKSSPEGLRL